MVSSGRLAGARPNNAGFSAPRDYRLAAATIQLGTEILRTAAPR